MRRTHRSLALALFFLAVGGAAFSWVYLGDLSRRGAVREDKARARRLFDFEPGDVIRSRIFARGSTLTFTRRDAGWDLLTPVRAPADPTALEAAIERMAAVTADAVEVEGEDLMRNYGLDPPKAWMEVVTSSGARTLFVGAVNALDGRVFVTDDRRARVFRAEPSFFWALDRSLEAFREHRVLPLPRKELVAISSSTPLGLEWKLRFDEVDRRWKVRGPDGPERDADEGEVHLLIVALTERLRAEHFRSEEVPPEGGRGLGRFGLERYLHRFELETRSGVVTRARLASLSETGAAQSARPVWWVEGTTSLIEVPSWAPRDLTRTPDELRNRTLARFDRELARRLDLEGDGRRYVFTRPSSEARWTLEPGNRAVREWIPAAILIGLSRLKVDQVKTENATPDDLRAFELDPPRRRLRAFGEAEALLADVRLGARDGETVLVGEANSPLVGRTGPRLDDLFPVEESNLLEPTP